MCMTHKGVDFAHNCFATFHIKVWNNSTLVPHFSTHQNECIKVSYTDCQRLTILHRLWHARCILLSERRNTTAAKPTRLAATGCNAR